MKKRLIDAAERSIWTFIQTFTAALTVGSFTDIEAVKLAGVAGGYAVGKYLLLVANGYLASPDPNLPSK